MAFVRAVVNSRAISAEYCDLLVFLDGSRSICLRLRLDAVSDSDSEDIYLKRVLRFVWSVAMALTGLKSVVKL